MARVRRIKGLTQKQTKFTKAIVQQIVDGKDINATQAVLESYNVSDPRSAQPIGSKLLSNNIIKQTVEETLANRGITLDTISENINRLASFQPEKITADVVLRSNVELAKLLNAYPNKKTAHLRLNLTGNVKDLDYKEAKAVFKGQKQELEDFVEEAGD